MSWGVGQGPSSGAWDGVEGAGAQARASEELMLPIPESHMGGPQGPEGRRSTPLSLRPQSWRQRQTWGREHPQPGNSTRPRVHFGK